MSSPASGVAAQAPSRATAYFWGMHAGLPPCKTHRHFAGDQDVESKRCNIAATIFVAVVVAIVADAAIAMALAMGMEWFLHLSSSSSHGNSSKGSSRSSSSCNSGGGQFAARVGSASPPAVVECWFSCGSALVMVQLGVA